jgi:molecular chaperone DnaK
MNPAVGVDLGTTNTVVAVKTDATGPRTLDIVQPVDERNVQVPRDHIKSAVYFESPDTAVVGAFAAGRLEAFRSIKSRMGLRSRFKHPTRERTTITPAWISAHILRLAYQQVRENFPDWDGRAIVTVPASFNTDQRNDTLRAATLAGFEEVLLLDEPTAAFYYFFDQNRQEFSEKDKQTILVFDFGGGTLDVSIIRVTTSGPVLYIDPIGRSRYNNLGGDDIDVEFAAFFLALWERQEDLKLETLTPDERKDLVQLFVRRSSEFKEEAEYYLANDQPLNEFIIDHELPKTHRTVHFHCQLTRPQYEEISGRFFLDKGDLNVFRPIGQALDVARSIAPGFRRDDIDLILYTGGASRMTGLKAALAAYFAPKPCFSITEEEACNTVALGAASCRYDEMQGQQGVKTTSRLLESIFTRDDDTGEYVPIVPLICEPSSDFKRVETGFQLQRPAIKLTLPLFRGVGPHDHHLVPMQDLVFQLDRVIPSQSPYRLFYRMTLNKTLEIRAVFEDGKGAPVQVDSEVEIHQEGKIKGPSKVPLARIN